MDVDVSSEPWTDELDASFPGWLLPSAARSAISPSAAARFLARLSGRPDHLDLLRASSVVVAHREELEAFVHEFLPDLVRVLPARTRVESRTWEGGFVGRLDIRATQRLHQAGQRSRFVTRTRRRDFDLPENLLLRSVCGWLLRELTRLASAFGSQGWMEPLADAALALRTVLNGSVLQEIGEVSITARHLRAADSAPHPAYRAAARWYRHLHAAFDDSDPARTARLLARGALRPVTAAKRFEIAVLSRLVGALWRHVQDGPDATLWSLEQTLILPGRDEVVVLRRADGAAISVYYDIARLPSRFRLDALNHYLGGAGSQRPDISLCRRHPNGLESWAVIEIKCSDRRSYLASGFDEALAYRAEYAQFLGGWPEAVLVCSSDIPGDVRRRDPVVAVDWRRWVPPELVEGLCDGLVPTRSVASSSHDGNVVDAQGDVMPAE